MDHAGEIDAQRLMSLRQAEWQALESLVKKAETEGVARLRVTEARKLGRLYRAASADLLKARESHMESELSFDLDVLVARSYAVVYGEPGSTWRRIAPFLWSDFPAQVRREGRLLALSAALIFLGACAGVWVVLSDPDAHAVVVPDMHLEQTPGERIVGEQLAGNQDVGRSTAFSSFLFTHNIQVTFLVFALGLTFGVGSAVLLFWNGIPIGSLAAQYHQSGHATFFWAWVLPHGVLELTVVIIAGAAGFMLARGLWFPGRVSRQAALLAESRKAIPLVLGGMPMLVVAGAVEGTLSQWHAPTLPYWSKLAFACLIALSTFGYLSRGMSSERARRPKPCAGD